MEIEQPFSLDIPIPVPDGGTGVTSLVPYAVLTGGTTTTGPIQQVSGLGTLGQALTSQGAGALPTWTTISAAPGGLDTQVQFNDSGSFGGNSSFTFNKTTGLLTLNATNSGTVKIGGLASAPSFGGIWFAQATPDTSNYSFLSAGSGTFINDATIVRFRAGNADIMQVSQYKVEVGYSSVGLADSTTSLFAVSGNNTYKAAVFQARSSQAENIVEIQNSTTGILSSFGATGILTLGLASTQTGTLKFNGTTSGTVTLKPADAAGTWSLTLPTTAGTNTYFLQTNGSGVTTWAAGEVALTFSTGLTRTVNTITADLSTGISGGQSVIGGTGASETLTLVSTTNGTKGNLVFHSTAVATLTPTGILSLVGGTANDIIPISSSSPLTIGGASQTGILTLGKSTDTNTINIGSGITASGKTQTISIGNGAGAGAATNVSILSGVGTAGTGTLTLGNNTRVQTIGLGNIAPAQDRTISIGSTGAQDLQNRDTINIGTSVPSGSGKHIITIGQSSLASSLALYTGTGNFILDGASSATYGIGGSLVTGTITVGDSSIMTGTITVGLSTDSNTINIGNADTITTKTQTINIGAGAGAGTGKSAVTVGSTANASSLVLQAGTGGVSITSSAWRITTSGAATLVTLNGNTITAGTGTLTLSTFTLTVGGNSSINGTFSGSSSGTNTGDITLSGENYVSLAGQAITASAVNLASSNVIGIPQVNNAPSSDFAIQASYSAVAVKRHVLGAGLRLTLNSGSIFAII